MWDVRFHGIQDKDVIYQIKTKEVKNKYRLFINFIMK